jgi:ferredoxin
MAETLKKVTIGPGCILCGACPIEAPEIFEMSVTTAVVKAPGVFPDSKKLQRAVGSCPVDVIKVEENAQ